MSILRIVNVEFRLYDWYAWSTYMTYGILMISQTLN